MFFCAQQLQLKVPSAQGVKFVSRSDLLNKLRSEIMSLIQETLMAFFTLKR